jgi:hypothetical protein
MDRLKRSPGTLSRGLSLTMREPPVLRLLPHPQHRNDDEANDLTPGNNAGPQPGQSEIEDDFKIARHKDAQSAGVGWRPP